MYQVNQLLILTCCCLCFAAACAEVEDAEGALVVSMVTLADTSPLAAAPAAAADAEAPPSEFPADWADLSVGTTKTSGAEDDEDCLEVPSPASLLLSRLAASLIMKAFLGDVN